MIPETTANPSHEVNTPSDDFNTLEEEFNGINVGSNSSETLGAETTNAQTDASTTRTTLPLNEIYLGYLSYCISKQLNKH